MANQPTVVITDEELIRIIRKAGKERLVETCQDLIGDPPNGSKSWTSLNSTNLATELVRALSREELLKIAAEGKAKQRAPSVGGPAWQHDGPHKLSAELVTSSLKTFGSKLGSYWREIGVSMETPALLDGVVDLGYTVDEWQPSAGVLVPTQARCSALILLDYEDQVTTVSARSDREALLIGAAWCDSVQSKLQPMVLSLSPEVSDSVLSAEAVQMLVAVYGRIGSVGNVINVDRIGTTRQDPTMQVDEQRALGEDKHVLDDKEIKGQLVRGDKIFALSFQFAWEHLWKERTQRLVSHVTLSSKEGPLILKVTRGGRSVVNASALYQALRKALGRDTPIDRVLVVEDVVARIKEV